MNQRAGTVGNRKSMIRSTEKEYRNYRGFYNLETMI
jgi:hypothetical protein